MSDPLGAVHPQDFDGIATVSALGPQGMVTLRGAFSDAAFVAGVTSVTEVDLPEKRQIIEADGRAAAWMSPDEVMILCSFADAADLAAQLSVALEGQFALAVNVSDARAVFEVSGANARDVLAKLTPADVSADALMPGEMRRTRLAQVPSALWMTDQNTFRVFCFRSVGQYMFDLLKTAAQQGSDVKSLA